MFKGVVHEDDEFAHDGGEGDFGGFTRLTQALVELFELAVGTGGDQGRHVEGFAHGRPSAANAAASVPLAAFARVRSQTGQGGGLTAIERAQFGQFGQNAQGGEVADSGDGGQLLHAFIQGSGLRAQGLELLFDFLEVSFQSAHQTLSLATQCGQGESLDLLALGHEDFPNLNATTDQLGQLLFLSGAGRGGLRMQALAISGQEGGIDLIGLGPLAGGAGEVANPGGIQDADQDGGLMQGSHNVSFVTAGGFTDDLNGGVSGQEFQELAMAGGGVGQVVETTVQVELQVKLGDIQARVDNRGSVRAHSCKYELALAETMQLKRSHRMGIDWW